MKLIPVFGATLTLLLAPSAGADVYPGDASYGAIVQDIYHEVTSDSIYLNWQTSITTRTELCEALTSAHNTGLNPGMSASNADWINESVSVDDCLWALWYTNGYPGNAAWNKWAGTHNGYWYDQTTQFHDSAYWAPAVGRLAASPSDVDSMGNRRVYSFQDVRFLDRTGPARYGWNQSHHEVDYVWGWDPKNSGNQNGYTGTHVGFTFEVNTASCIIWVTSNEAFLECVKQVGSSRRRTSAGFFGMGQWTVSNQIVAEPVRRHSVLRFAPER